MTSRRAFGETLRRQREQRGVTLETISDLTKISVTLLTALEHGDCSRWPGGIYSRAYIRDYAQAVGLDRDEVVEQFTECFAQTAFPEGAPERRAAARHASSTPLRMTFGEAPQERRRVIAGRAVAAALDLVLTASLATLLSVATNAGFWMALAGVSLCWQTVGVLTHGSFMPPLLARAAARMQARRPDPAHEAAADPALAEAT